MSWGIRRRRGREGSRRWQGRGRGSGGGERVEGQEGKRGTGGKSTTPKRTQNCSRFTRLFFDSHRFLGEEDLVSRGMQRPRCGEGSRRRWGRGRGSDSKAEEAVAGSESRDGKGRGELGRFHPAQEGARRRPLNRSEPYKAIQQLPSGSMTRLHVIGQKPGIGTWKR